VIAADTVRLAFRNLGQARLRTGLTTMGVAIGIASLAGMVSLGVGLQDQLMGRFLKSGMFDSITVMPVQPRIGIGRGGLRGRQGFPGLAGRRGGAPGRGAPAMAAEPRLPLDDGALKKIAGVAQVKNVYPDIRVPVELRFEDASDFSVATGVPLSSRGEGAFQTFAAGTFFKNETDSACLLTVDMAKRLSERDPKELIGQPLTLVFAGRGSGGDAPGTAAIAPYTIIGIVDREPGLGGDPTRSGLMIPLARAREMMPAAVVGLDGSKTYNSITVKVTRAQYTQDVEDRIKELGYGAFSLNDALEGAKRAFILLDLALSLIGSIALAVSSLGIVNTMVMSILERTREIGIMKAIGGSDGDIRKIFLVEASAIGLLGGFLGVALGWLVGRIINFGANIYIQNQGGTPGNLFSLPFWLIGGAIGFSIVISLIAGSYPAARAAKLDPIRALRHD
jgi:putative ABC transport system permease protein